MNAEHQIVTSKLFNLVSKRYWQIVSFVAIFFFFVVLEERWGEFGWGGECN